MDLTIDDVRGRIHAAVITIRPDEYDAVESRLQGLTSLEGGINSYEYATVETDGRGPISVVLTRCVTQGNLTALAVANGIISDLDPSWLFLVGIAGGVPDYEFSLGDVVLASRLDDFSFGAADPDGTRSYQSAGGPMHPDVIRFLSTKTVGKNRQRLISLAGFTTDDKFLTHPSIFPDHLNETTAFYGEVGFQDDTKRKLRRRFPDGRRIGGPTIWSGPCANGNILLKNSELLSQWRESARQIVDVETELAGVYVAARSAGRQNYPVLAIRALSDVVGLKRDPGWTSYACESAAALAYSVLRSGFINFEGNLPQEWRPSEPPPAAMSRREGPAKPTPPATSGPGRHLPSVPYCFGRDLYVEETVSALTDERAGRAIIYGPPGIGKGTVALKALGNPAAERRFGNRRFLVKCESAHSYSALLQIIADVLSVPPAESVIDLRHSLLLELECAPSLLLLDNIETPLHGRDSAEVEQFLIDLAASPIGLLVAYRGNRPPPTTIKWDYSRKLPPLSPENAREVFLAITGNKFAADPFLDKLVTAMDRVPLAIKLLAHRATFETELEHLWKLWRDKGTAILDRGIGNERNRSLATSLALTIENEWMKSPQETLLSCLAFLPNGMSRLWLRRPELGNLDPALSTLVQLGLVEEYGLTWLRLLTPIREYVRERFRQSIPEFDTLSRLIVSVAAYDCSKIGSFQGRDAVERIRPVLANIEVAIRHTLNGSHWQAGVRAAHRFTAAVVLGRIGDRSIIDEAYEKTKAESVKDPSLIKSCRLIAQLRQSQARIAEDVGNLDQAESGYREAIDGALKLQKNNAKPLLAKLEKDLADIALQKGDLPTAQTRYTNAKTLFNELKYERQSQDCDVGRALVVLRRGEARPALKMLDALLQDAITLERQKLVKRVEARIYFVRIEAFLAVCDEEKALGSAIKALMEFSPTGDVKNCAKCIASAASIICDSSDEAALFRKYVDSLSTVRSTGEPIVPQNLLFGHIHAGFARKAVLRDDRAFHVKAASTFWRTIGRDDLVRGLQQLGAELDTTNTP